jgi:hypothetical protein
MTFEEKAQLLMVCEKRMREFIMRRGIDRWGCDDTGRWLEHGYRP